MAALTFQYDERLRPTRVSVGLAPLAVARFDRDDVVREIDVYAGGSVGGTMVLERGATGAFSAARYEGARSAYSYSEYGELSGQEDWHETSRVYALGAVVRDGLGRVVSEEEEVLGEPEQHDYVYDAAGRLAEVWRDGELSSRYSYDANGNRILKEGPDGVEEGSYDEADRVLSYGAYAYTLDANGRLATRSERATGAVTRYVYDGLGGLRSVERADGTRIEYDLEPMGRRFAKRVNGVLRKRWVYQDALRPVAELDESGAVVAQFVYADARNVPALMVKGSNVYRLVTDIRGSVRVVINAASGSIAQRIDYDEFGRVLNDTNPGFQPFGFAGGLYDADTGLVRYGARDYDPYTGRWTARDPILFRGGDANLYAYVGNDPVNLIDPTGHLGMLATGAIGAGIGFVAGGLGAVSQGTELQD